jgi:hypothetical protein
VRTGRESAALVAIAQADPPELAHILIGNLAESRGVDDLATWASFAPRVSSFWNASKGAQGPAPGSRCGWVGW